jgi:mono/diheme cytochrome c family protein
MQLYKGNIQADNTINWVDPKPLPANPQLTALQRGESLFKGNCASCHDIDRDLTGPALGGALERVLPLYNGDKRGLYAFTRNPAKEMARESYYVCLKNKFGGVVMTSFPDLTDKDLDNLYGYIENETKRIHLPISDNGIKKCRDSCKLYLKAAKHWKKVKAKLESEAVDMTVEKRSPTSDTTGPPVKVSPTTNTSLYYQFNIEAFGWYNVDILMKNLEGVQPSELMVRVKGKYKERFAVYLIIPSIKLLASGGPLKDEEDLYGFDKADGSIRLPQNEPAYIIAMGEREDQIIFSKTAFTTSTKQSLELSLTTITKDAFQQQITGLQLNDITIQAKDTKNAAELRNAVKELEKADQLKPKNCDCDCFLDKPATVDEIDDMIYLGFPGNLSP